MKRTSRSPVGIYTIGIASLFMVGFFLLVVFGARIYRDTVDSQTGNNDTRAVLAYLSAAVKSGDERGAVSIEPGDEGDILIILSDMEKPEYATKVYLYEGFLMEENTRTDSELNPAFAQKLGRTSTFQIEKQDGRLSIQTDEGNVLVCLRSERK